MNEFFIYLEVITLSPALVKWVPGSRQDSQHSPGSRRDPAEVARFPSGIHIPGKFLPRNLYSPGSRQEKNSSPGSRRESCREAKS